MNAIGTETHNSGGPFLGTSGFYINPVSEEELSDLRLDIYPGSEKYPNIPSQQKADNFNLVCCDGV